MFLIVVMIALSTFMTWVSCNAWRTGIIQGGYGRATHRAKRPRTFAVLLAAVSTYAVIFWIGTAFWIYLTLKSI